MKLPQQPTREEKQEKHFKMSVLIMFCRWMVFVFPIFIDEISVSSAAEGATIHKWIVEDYLIPNDHIALHYNKEQPLMWNDNCQSSTLFIHKGMVYLHSGKGVKGTYSAVVIPKTVLRSTSAEVTSASFAASYLLLVIEGAVFTYNIDTGLVVPANGIHAKVTHVASHQCCHSNREWCQANSNIVIAYNEEQEGNSRIQYYISYDAGLQFVARHVVAKHIGHVYGAVILHAHSEVAFLVKTNSYTAQFVHGSYKSDRVISITSVKSVTFEVEGDDVGVKQLQSGIDSLLIWDEKKLFYSISAGKTVLLVEVISSAGISLSPLVGQHVQQVVADKQGNFAVMTDKNNILFGREAILSQAVELDVSISCNQSCLLQWADSRHLSVMYPIYSSSNQFTLKMRSSVINVQRHLGAIEEASTCVFQAFNGEFHDQVYYLDIGASINISATFIPEKWQHNWFMVGVSNPSIAKVQSSSHDNGILPTGLSQISVNAHVDVVASSLPNGNKEVARGTSALWMTAMNTSLTCPYNPMLVAQIAAECPPYKNIRLRKEVRIEKTSCEELKSYSYVIKKDHYDSSFQQDSHIINHQEDKTILYDYAKLGCPVRKYYGDTFKPKFDLYHGDSFVEEVLVDYVLYEVHGVVTFGYTKTATQVGCVSAPQSWSSMLMQQISSDPATAWTRMNYQSCFNNGSEVVEPGQIYEVISNRTTNALRWDDYNTIYVFHVTVVDPDYSFCHLTTKFAVQVYGALPQAAVLPLRIMLSTCGIGLGVLAAGFVVHNIRGGYDSEEEETEENH